MLLTDSKTLLKSQLISYLEAKGIDISQPFNCLNPKHPDNHPSMRYDAARNRVHCFSCGKGGDIIDLIGLEHGLTEDKDKFAKAYELLDVEDGVNTTYHTASNSCDIIANIDVPPNASYNDSSLSDTTCINYLNQRCISLETAKKYGVSFERDWVSPKALSKAQTNGTNPPPATPRIIIPTSDASYVAIDTRPTGLSPNQENFRKMKHGSAHIFNAEALKEEKPCFVVEGEFDALSFLEIGYNAVALGSVSNTKIFIEQLKQLNVKSPLILALDNDDAGNKATADLEKLLQDTGRSYIVADTIYQNYKDANDYICANKQAFIQSSLSVINSLPEYLEVKRLEIEEKTKQEYDNYKNTSVYGELDALKDYIASTKNLKNISTGFFDFDQQLGGGLVEGLYVIGALTSLGKTTFAMQIADHLATQGIDVLYFSLEMSKSQLIAKSISRHTFLDCMKNDIDYSLAKTARGILDGRRYKNYNSDSLKLIEDAYESYKSYAGNLYLREGFGSIGISQITESIEKHIKYTGKTPIVFIDYIQILAPDNSKSNEKQNVDNTVLELKRISRDYKTSIIGISSLNRASYNSKMSLESFKESGGIEYASDVLIGLQYTGIGEKMFDINFAKRKDPRDLELVIIKNRNGISGTCLGFTYYPKFNFFKLNSNYSSVLPEFKPTETVSDVKNDDSRHSEVIYDRKERNSLSLLLTNLDTHCIYGLDIETTGLKATSSKIALLQIYNPKDDRVYVYQLNNAPLDDIEKSLLAKLHFVAHNAAFEKSFMPYLEKLECSMLLYHAVKSDRNCGIANLESVTGISYNNKKEMQKSNWQTDTLTPEQLEYAAKDAKATYVIWNTYKDANTEVYNRMKQASPIIDYYANRGLPVDIKALQSLKRQKEKERDADLQEIISLGYENIITPKGFTTKKELLKTLSPEAKSLVDKVRSCNSYINNLISGIEKQMQDCRLPINVLICGTETGRLSTVKPNVQNFPRHGFRHIFRADKDYSIVKADFAGQELRMAAAISGETVMLDAFNNGIDLHALMAAKLNKITIDEFKNRDKDWKKSERQKAKAANFGFLYGMGAKKFVNIAKDNYGVELTEDESERIKRTFWQSYPILNQWCIIERRKCTERGYALTLGGRKRYFPDIQQAYCEQINTAVQGSAADVLLETLIALPSDVSKYLINTVHDELVFEVPKSLLTEDFKSSIEAAMIKGVQTISPEYPIRDIAEIKEVETL